ncbi:WD domain, G-beta repeat containing protein [Coccidioides posadasii C735 delta SOWgp]|uniref:WD domain, G-beta repeat containing protein n=1 Tax=Coccidioides posadasii (strain C735) TaxID=222929 RepID=C5PGF6_COCP7|nr:WD domain, G-beta repeat containing protein [Coccidioides posadasii C735 delta SOWgp]EER23609.1 WD domain, G-beta repeat containing protein [Coccidioides posadasii C735 delta SOWgp]|eukprot:XP_003065754.1 WD domain, G-beta repeat containing protein [Coccidioides posadasii C735 delta SOWgp]
MSSRRCRSTGDLRSSNVDGFLAPLFPFYHDISGFPDWHQTPEKAPSSASHSPSPRSALDSNDGRLPCPSPKTNKDPGVLCDEQDACKPSSKKIGVFIPSPDQASPRKDPSYFDRRCKDGSPVLESRSLVNSPDRFVPSRELHFPPETQFRVSKNHDLLTPHEKAHRRRDPNADPFFIPTASRIVNNPRRFNPIDIGLIPHYRPRHVHEMGFTDLPAAIDNGSAEQPRQVSVGAVWHVGGTSPALSDPATEAPDDIGYHRGSGTVAPRYSAKFDRKETDAEQHRIHEARIALALDLDPASRILGFTIPGTPPDTPSSLSSPGRVRPPLTWKDSVWTKDFGCTPTSPKNMAKGNERLVSTVPFRVLDAPFLRDDFYSTTLAYCHKIKVLAVGLSSRVYLWSEQGGVRNPPLQQVSRDNVVTSLSFSSEKGGWSILAVGRRHGELSLWSTFDAEVRFEAHFPAGVACVSFKDTPSIGPSEWSSRISASIEHLAVGDDAGNVWYYTLEWTTPRLRKRRNWNGSMTLIARIASHTQQICGLSWSPDGKYFATGGNDNVCLLFETASILAGNTQSEQSCSNTSMAIRTRPPKQRHMHQVLPLHHQNYSTVSLLSDPTSRDAESVGSEDPLSELSQAETVIHPRREKHILRHYAAVKAISFAPWEPTLLATGGGADDQCIRFWHAPTGALLASLNVYAQVTSLIWSRTRREIAATFGYAKPPHPYRIAVFAWPSCEQVLAIPWADIDDMEGYDDNTPGRALWAISYPGGPNQMPVYASGRSQVTSEASDDGTPSRLPSHIRRQSPHRGGRDPSSSSQIANVRYTEGRIWSTRTEREGCIVIACSDESIRFQEVWGGEPRGLGGSSGVLGGSQILESLHGLDTSVDSKEIIR